MDRSIIPAPTHQKGELVHGFRLQEVTAIDDIKAMVYELRHEASGASVVHVHCNDEENLFSVGFITAPEDSTGVAHILEHSVLSGSERFPVKDAFNELRKRTLNTFINAMTWPDRTVYPTASAVEADYFNLAQVYLDLVFKPRLSLETFKQEGHHLEPSDLEDPMSPLKISGVVYNEMKGANSQPERVIYRSLMAALAPDTPYAHDSGGDPEEIPKLSYEAFKAFHRRYYSAANARFFLYGNIDLAKNMAFLDAFLQTLPPSEAISLDEALPLQRGWEEPREESITYAIGPQDSEEDKTFVMLSWLTCEMTDDEEVFLLDVLNEALAGSAAGPLRKVLSESGLGQAVFPSGSFGAFGRQTQVSFGLRGTNPDKIEAIEELVLTTLQKVVDEGLERDLVEAAFHQIEFAGKEIEPPFPIMLMMRAKPIWYYGGDPKSGLRFSHLVEMVRQRWAAEPRLFEKLIEKWLLNNTSRVRFVALPSKTLAATRDEALAQELKAKAEALDAAQRQALVDQAKALLEAQLAPEDPAAIASLPMLAVEDIPREVRCIPHQSSLLAGAEYMEHPVFSNGVGYVGLLFDSRDLTEEEAILVPLLGTMTRGLGAAGRSYAEMATRIDRYTGGIGLSELTGNRLDGSLPPFVFVSAGGALLEHNAAPFFEILSELLTQSNIDNPKRVKELLLESAASLDSAVVSRGHAFARSYAAAVSSASSWRAEQWTGLSQVRLLKQLADEPEASATTLIERLGALQQKLFTRDRVILSCAGDPALLESIRPHAESFIKGLPQGHAATPLAIQIPQMPTPVAVTIPAAVNYVAQVMDLPNMTDERAASIELFSKVLRAELLYKRIRVQGGAYGAMSLYNRNTGQFSLLSYRDPNLSATYQTFDQVADYLASNAFNDAVLEDSRIGAIGDLEGILSPSQQLSAARARWLIGLDDEQRRAYRERFFELDAAQIRHDVLPLLREAQEKARRAALVAAPLLEKERAQLPDELVVEKLEG